MYIRTIHHYLKAIIRTMDTQWKVRFTVRIDKQSKLVQGYPGLQPAPSQGTILAKFCAVPRWNTCGILLDALVYPLGVFWGVNEGLEESQNYPLRSQM